MNPNPKPIIGIIGLGYVGLPLAVVAAEAGFEVLGFDVNASVCDGINAGISHIKDIPSPRLQPLVEKGIIRATTNFEALKDCGLVSICVPTPLNKIKDPDLSYVVSATEAIATRLQKGQIVILESTTYPGTTRDLMLPLFEKTGFKVGQDFYLCFSPERVDPGNEKWTTKNTPKVLGGITEECRKAGLAVYEQIFDRMVPVQNTEAAELVKVYENTFRMINIALANEFSMVCDRLGISVWEVIDAAATKPFGFMKFTPGPGLGGHCIPLDPHYLSWKMRNLSFKTRMIELASEINGEMPEYTVNKVALALNEQGKSLKGSIVLLLGIAYKKDIDDLRESPALDIIRILHQRGAIVKYHDSYCPVIADDGHTDIPSLPIHHSELSDELLKQMDAVVVVTDHSHLPYQALAAQSKVWVDMRGVVLANHK
jgi:UDP-N-acetyl-D-glucosamine dehydrogenase